MFKTKSKLSFLVAGLVFLLLATFSMASAEVLLPEEPVQNIILLIGDGMGPSQVQLARYYSLYQLNQDLNMLRMAEIGATSLVATRSLDYLVTDSAAAGTALATGYKTNNGMISQTPDGSPLLTILEKAQALGKSTGLVSTTRLTHATPAVFASHIYDRDLENEIAVQMVESGTNVMLAGGRRHFIPQTASGSKREDDRNLLSEAENLGFVVVQNAEELRSIDPQAIDNLLGLFTGSHMSYEIDRNPAEEPSVAEMTQKALDILSQNPEGFFLMVEGGRIDHACHANDAAATIHDTLAFDEAVGVALDFWQNHPNTLIIVTADHETGGLCITEGQVSDDGGLEYLKVTDLETIAQIKGSFEGPIYQGLETAQSLADIQTVIEEYTGIAITEEEATLVQEGKAWVPVYDNQPGNSISRAIQDEIKISWGSGQHSAEPVPLFAVGPYASSFDGFIDNTEVNQVMSQAFQADY